MRTPELHLDSAEEECTDLGRSGVSTPLLCDDCSAAWAVCCSGEAGGVDVQEEVEREDAKDDVHGKQDAGLFRGVSEPRPDPGSDENFSSEEQGHLARYGEDTFHENRVSNCAAVERHEPAAS